MTSVGVGLLIPKRLPRLPLLAALRREPQIHIVFEVYDVRDLPCGRSVRGAEFSATTGVSARSVAAERRAPAADSGGNRPEVIVADMDVGAGLRTVLRLVRARFPGVPVVMLDRAGDSARAQRARNLGVAAVLTRRSPPERFVARVLDVANDYAWATGRAVPRLYEPLTPREWDILPFIARRYSAKEIAEALTISYATVRTHIRNIYAKCGVGSRRHAARVAESLLRRRYSVGDNTVEEVSREDVSRRRDGRSDPEPERVQIHPGQGSDRRRQRVVR